MVGVSTCWGSGPAHSCAGTGSGSCSSSGSSSPELPAAENVALPLLLGGRRRSQAMAEAGDWFEQLEIAGLEQCRPGELSGGEAQRVAAYADREVVVRDGRVSALVQS